MTLVLEFVATFCAGVFFGAALYISIAQHPATLKAGAAVGARFFPPMYQRAAPMQIILAVIGSLAGLAVWLLDNSLFWLVGSIFLISVIPITLVAIKPINDLLLDPDRDPDASNTEDLLRQWGPRHWWRSIVSGVAFVVFLLAHASA